MNMKAMKCAVSILALIVIAFDATAQDPEPTPIPGCERYECDKWSDVRCDPKAGGIGNYSCGKDGYHCLCDRVCVVNGVKWGYTASLPKPEEGETGDVYCELQTNGDACTECMEEGLTFGTCPAGSFLTCQEAEKNGKEEYCLPVPCPCPTCGNPTAGYKMLPCNSVTIVKKADIRVVK